MKPLLRLPSVLFLCTIGSHSASCIELKQLEGTWIVERLGSPSLQVAVVTAQSKGGQFIISVSPNYSFKFRTIHLRQNEDRLTGTAQLSGQNAQEVDVELRITEGGAKMEAVPRGFRNLESWRFRRSAFQR